MHPAIKNEMKRAEKKIEKCLFDMINDHDFYGHLLLSMNIECLPIIPTMGTDGDRIVYNPLFVNNISRKKLRFAMSHEVYHVIFKHHLRSPVNVTPEELYGNVLSEQEKAELMRTHRKWNKAGDYVINPQLESDGFPRYKEFLFDDRYKGMTAEAVFKKLPDEPEQSQNGNGGSQQAENGNQDGSENGTSGKGNDNKGSQQGQGTGEDENGQYVGDVFSAGKGKKLSKAEKDQKAREIDQKVINAARIAKRQGTLPAGMARYVDSLTETKVNYIDLLREFMETVMDRSDYDWSFPNRRFIPGGYYLPSIAGEDDEMPETWIFMDTSGSIGQRELQILGNEIASVLDQFKTKVHVAYIDAAMHNTETFEHDDIINGKLKLHPQGGGGTSFVPGFKYLEEKDIEPVCLLYFTDLCCNDFPEEPDFPVFWGHVGNSGWGKNDPPFGEVVELELGNE